MLKCLAIATAMVRHFALSFRSASHAHHGVRKFDWYYSASTTGTSRFSEKLSSAGSGFIRVLNGMAAGLFSSLIIGLILKQLDGYAGIQLLVQIGSVAQYMMGPAIGAGVGIALGAPSLVVVLSLPVALIVLFQRRFSCL